MPLFGCCLVTSDSFATPWAIAHRAPLSMEFSREEFWSGFPFPSPGDLLNPGKELMSPALASGFFATEPPGKPLPLFVKCEAKSLSRVQLFATCGL